MGENTYTVLTSWADFDNTVNYLSENFDETYSKAFRIKQGVTYVDAQYISELVEFSADLFGVWIDSIWRLIEMLGHKNVFDILKRLAIYREIFWDISEYDIYEDLPDVIKIYRGGQGPIEEVLKGFSWSAHLTVAKEFAEKHPNGIVLSAEISKKDILLINPYQAELVPEPATLRSVQIVLPCECISE